MAKYDYLIVGAGLFGSTWARQATDAGRKCLVIEKRGHIAGNTYTEKINGINVHKYGAHIFHTNNKDVWDYLNRFGSFNHYRHKVFVKWKDGLYSFPINLMTMAQLWGLCTPAQARKKFEEVGEDIFNPTNFEECFLKKIGRQLYETFIEGYTRKQWHRDPCTLPVSLAARMPVRLDLNNDYFLDTYQGIPRNGYTCLVANMLRGIEVKLRCDYLEGRTYWDAQADYVVYTGPIDAYFGYVYGRLGYLSLEFRHGFVRTPDFQGTSVVNYTEESVPYTRIIEHKHFEFGKQEDTIITMEHPKPWSLGAEPYYPVNDSVNDALYDRYRRLTRGNRKVIFGGRLGEFRYYDMHHVVASALAKVERHLGKISKT